MATHCLPGCFCTNVPCIHIVVKILVFIVFGTNDNKSNNDSSH
jgi:hypothetical protein